MQMQCFISPAAQPQPGPRLKALRASGSPWGGWSYGGEWLEGSRGRRPRAPAPPCRHTPWGTDPTAAAPPAPAPHRNSQNNERKGGKKAKSPSPALGSVYPFRAAEAHKLPTAESPRNAVTTGPRRGTGVLQAALDLIKKIKGTFRAVSPI